MIYIYKKASPTSLVMRKPVEILKVQIINVQDCNSHILKKITLMIGCGFVYHLKGELK